MARLTLIAAIGPAVLATGLIFPDQVPPDYQRDIFPLFKRYCGSCHGTKDAPGGVALMAYTTADSLTGHRDVWERVITNLSNGHMPPAGMPQPTAAERQRLVTYVRDALYGAKPNPGRVTMRRLNREEYNNTIRDLVGVDLRPADDFPSDDVGYGFDNIGDVLSMSPLLMEKYLKAAQTVSEAAIYVPTERHWQVSGAELKGDNSNGTPEGGRLMFANAELRHTFQLPAEGDYKITVTAYQQRAGSENAKLSLRVNGREIKLIDVASLRPARYETTVHIAPGTATLGTAFVNDFYVAKTDSAPAQDRNLGVDWIEVTGPLKGTEKTPPNPLLIAKPSSGNWTDAEKKVLGAFASRAYRRPATSAEVQKLVAIAELAHKNGETYERAIQLGMTAALCSPNFLFRAERPEGERLNSYEIASRLSYFLWSSMPDDELFARAARNELTRPEILATEVRRMLQEPRADALADNFAGQWLQTRKLSVVAPDRKMFPFSDELRRAMATETRRFFLEVVRNDRSVLDFIDGRYSFVNEPLARLYGIQGVQGREFRRVELPPNRVGVLTQASVLTVTSNPTRTSPVKRGKWILENILGSPPPPPPPGVGVLKDDPVSTEASSLRERMQQHRKDPLCASCHVEMDGLGFALENFDAIGAWRTKDGRFDVDASGSFSDGTTFTGPVQLRDAVMKRKDKFVRCLSEKMLTYALGRGVESYDRPEIDRIASAVSRGEYKFSTLVTAIVESDPFLKAGASR